MRKKLTCIDISKLLELKKILLEEKFLKISTTFFLIFDPVCISIFNNYISKDVNELYLLLRFVMMFFALFNLFLFTSNEFITFCCNPSVEKDLNNLRNLDIEKYNEGYIYMVKDSGQIFMDADGKRILLGNNGVSLFYGADEKPVENPDLETGYILVLSKIENYENCHEGDLILNKNDGAFYQILTIDEPND